MKRIVSAVILSLAIFMLAGCGKISEINSSELAEKIYTSVAFSENLTQIEGSAAEKRYFLNPNDYSEITAYVGTKATCDEFVIIKTNNTENIMSKLRGHLDVQKANYSSYRPAEAQKIDSAVLEEYKGTVVLIVSGDSANALNVYSEYLMK